MRKTSEGGGREVGQRHGWEGKVGQGQLLRRLRGHAKEAELLLGAKGSFRQGNDRMRFVSLDNPDGRMSLRSIS